MKLNGWQRIGVVISGVWLVAISVVVASNWADRRHASSAFVHRIVAESPANVEAVPPARSASQLGRPLDFEDFVPGPEATSKTRYEFDLRAFVVALLVPVALAWMLAYAVIGLFRWVVAGFKRRD